MIRIKLLGDTGLFPLGLFEKVGDTYEKYVVCVSGPVIYHIVNGFDIHFIVVIVSQKFDAMKAISSIPRGIKYCFISFDGSNLPDHSCFNMLMDQSEEKMASLLHRIYKEFPVSSHLVYDKSHIISKLNKYLELINTRRVMKFCAATNGYVCKNASGGFTQPSIDPKYQWEPFDSSKDFDFGKTKYQWYAFKADLSIPQGFNPEKELSRVVFHVNRNYLDRPWDDDTPVGPEGRFWINGKAIAAIDEFHDGAFVQDGGSFELRLFTGRCNSQHTLSKFGIEIIHKDTESLYQRLRFYLSIIKEMKEENPDRSIFINILDQSLRYLDIRDLNYPIKLDPIREHDPSDIAFYNSVSISLRMITKSLRSMPKHSEEGNDPSISIIGYSHLDTCWLWPFSFSHYKSINTATSMLYLIENPPHEFNDDSCAKWRFLATAAQHYKWMKEDDPDIYQRVINAAHKGRWDVNGVMWLEPDTTLPSGESLVRQVLYGTRAMEQEMGFKQSVLFLPDCFGFTAALPQIMRKAGIDAFITSKISWCEYTHFPYSTFKWRGIDGSSILTHFISTPSQWSYQTSTYTGVATAREMIGTYNQYKQSDIIRNSALHTAGNGDGGGGITDEMVWNMNLMKELPKLEGIPKVVFPSLDSIFDEIRRNEKLLPIWDDELYLEYHRGTLTTQEEVKRQNRLLEAHLHNSEWLLVLCFSLLNTNINEYQKSIRLIWENTLLFQFHDSLPGTSVNEANQDIIQKGRESLNSLAKIEKELLGLLSKAIQSTVDGFVLFNGLSFDRYQDGNLIPSYGWSSSPQIPSLERIETTTYQRTQDDSYCIKELTIERVNTLSPIRSKVSFDPDSFIVTTPYLKVSFSSNGIIKSIKDILSDREFLSGPSNVFELYEDRPINWPAWDIQLYHKEMEIEGPTFISMEWKEGFIETRWAVPTIGEGKTEKTEIHQVITFSDKYPVIDFQTKVNWTQHDKLLKVRFPTTIRARTAKYGIQFGYIQRPTHLNTKRDMAKFEVSGRWGDLSDINGGIALCSSVKSGFDIHDDTIRMSLLKSPMQTDKWADFGKRMFSYRIVAHSTPFEKSSIQQRSDELIVPPVFTQSSPTSNCIIPSTASFVSSSNPCIIIDTVKPCEDDNGFIVRLYESSGGWGTSIIVFSLLQSSNWTISHVDLRERPIECPSTCIQANNLAIKVEANPFEIISLMLKKK